MLKTLFAVVSAALLSGTLLFSADAHAHGRPPGKKSEPAAASKKGAKPEKQMPENAKSDPRAAQAPADDSAAPAGAPAVVGEARRGMGRIEFDDRLIKGQTNKANAIYLFERRESALRSLLKKRTNFHDEIDETLE